MIFGITGGSGSGKTALSSMLSELGVFVIDADKISREVTGKGSRCLKELCEAFGEKILTEDGSLNRGRLAAAAFASKDKTAQLSNITHKYIKDEIEKRISASDAALTAIDGAVIIGSPVEPLCEKIVLVTAERNVRLKRIKRRDGLTADEAEKRLDAQPSDEFYIKNSDYIVNNSQGAEELRKQALELYNKLKEV